MRAESWGLVRTDHGSNTLCLTPTPFGVILLFCPMFPESSVPQIYMPNNEHIIKGPMFPMIGLGEHRVNPANIDIYPS